MAVESFFRVQCDGGCERWLTDVTVQGAARTSSARGSALVFPSAERAAETAASVGWTGPCTCPHPEGFGPHVNPDCPGAIGLVCKPCQSRIARFGRDKS